VNQFAGAAVYSLDDVRQALAVPSFVPVVHCDVRERASAKYVLVTVTEHALARRAGAVARR
jgi:uncharacterized protein